MDTIIFYTDLDKVIGCTRDNTMSGEPFCDACRHQCSSCSFKGQHKSIIQQNMRNEQQLKTTFIKLYLEKSLRIY